MRKSSLCFLCPRDCLVNRQKQLGFCQASDGLEISWFGPHRGEEPAISGSMGSGTIFFGHCNLSCVYCQNWQISQKKNQGIEKTSEELAEIFLDLQNQGLHNINLVTPTIWTLQIIEAIKRAKLAGLKIPVVWNSNAYEKVETLKKLEGLVNIYLPDYKYGDDELALRYSACRNYSSVAQKAILEMQRQVGDLVVDENGIAQKGLIIRHLVLPKSLGNTRKALLFIRSVSDNVFLSFMTQYYPTHKANHFQTISRCLTQRESSKAKAMVFRLDFRNGWLQEEEAAGCLRPDFTQKKPFG